MIRCVSSTAQPAGGVGCSVAWGCGVWPGPIWCDQFDDTLTGGCSQYDDTVMQKKNMGKYIVDPIAFIPITVYNGAVS